MSIPLAIDSRLLASVEDLPLLAQTVVEGFLDGLHRSPFLGYSTEFASYRQYVQGDNLRHLDWKVWARSDALYVKQFEDDTNYRGQIYLDTSASMDFGTGPANKFTYGRLLAAALTHLMILQRDAPGLVLFGPDSRQALPCAASRNQAMELFAALARAQAGGQTIIGQNLFGIVQAVVRRGISVVISDFSPPTIRVSNSCASCMRTVKKPSSSTSSVRKNSNCPRPGNGSSKTARPAKSASSTSMKSAPVIVSA